MQASRTSLPQLLLYFKCRTQTNKLTRNNQSKIVWIWRMFVILVRDKSNGKSKPAYMKYMAICLTRRAERNLSPWQWKYFTAKRFSRSKSYWKPNKNGSKRNNNTFKSRKYWEPLLSLPWAVTYSIKLKNRPYFESKKVYS